MSRRADTVLQPALIVGEHCSSQRSASPPYQHPRNGRLDET